MNNLDRIKSLRAQDYGVAGLSTTDVDWLIAEVERLTAERDHAARSAELWESEYRTCYAAMEDYKHAWLEGRAIMAVCGYFSRMRGPVMWQYRCNYHDAYQAQREYIARHVCDEARAKTLECNGYEVRPLYAGFAPAQPAVQDDVAKDAARYRWLRDNAEKGAVRTLLPLTRCHYVIVNESAYDYPEFDEAIDAAILSATDDKEVKNGH